MGTSSIQKIFHFQCHYSCTKYLFRQMSMVKHVMNLYWEKQASYFFLTSIQAHFRTKISILSGLKYSKRSFLWNGIIIAFSCKCHCLTWMINLFGVLIIYLKSLSWWQYIVYALWYKMGERKKKRLTFHRIGLVVAMSMEQHSSYYWPPFRITFRQK